MSYKPCPSCGKPIDCRNNRCRSCNKINNNHITGRWVHRKYGYIEIVVDGKRMQEHRYITEQSIGRKLNRNEVVHHIDGDRMNNDIDNLQLMTLSEHSRMHMKRNGFPKLDEAAEKRRREGVLKSIANGRKRLPRPAPRNPSEIHKEHSEKMKLWWSNHK